MRLAHRIVALLSLTAAALAAPLAAAAFPSGVGTFTWSNNMHPLGEAPAPISPNIFNSDLAFWGKVAFQGTYNGFNVIDITEPDNPVTILDYNDCAPNGPSGPVTTGNQGDIVVWGDILVRSWNSPVPATGSSCGGDPLPEGYEGLDIFDISDLTAPDHLASVDLPAGSHTLTLVPDVANDRLLVYNSSSSAANPGIDIVEVPLANPAAATPLRFEPAGRSCHDTGVVLGEAMLAACAGSASGVPGVTVWSLSPDDGGSLTDPVQLYQVSVANTTTGHSAAFTWDGEVLVFGTEPGGGSQARCQATGSPLPGGLTQTNEMKSMFFFDARTGAALGTFVLPRAQTATENCTIHNYNIVPTSRRYVAVSGNYQAGISVVDFTNPGAAREIAFADPAPLSTTSIILGGDWSTYWYNGRIYESDITRGMFIWQLSDPAVAGAMRLGHLNPQTAEFTLR